MHAHGLFRTAARHAGFTSSALSSRRITGGSHIVESDVLQAPFAPGGRPLRNEVICVIRLLIELPLAIVRFLFRRRGLRRAPVSRALKRAP